MPTRGTEQFIPFSAIGVVDRQRVKANVEATHHQGFLNEVYELVAERVAFQLTEIEVAFRPRIQKEKDAAAGSAWENSIEVTFDIKRVKDLLTDYFYNHPEIFYSFFEEHKKFQPDKYFDDYILGNSLDTVLAELTTPDNQVVLDRLIGITPHVLSHPLYLKRLMSIVDEAVRVVIHERAHILLARLAPHYGMTHDFKSIEIILSVFSEPDVLDQRKAFLEQIDLLIHPRSDTALFEQLGQKHIEFVCQKLLMKYGLDQVISFLRIQYAVGIEEIVIRLIEAKMRKETPRRAVMRLQEELYETPSYYLKNMGVILPEREPIFALIKQFGIEQAYHQILKQYNDYAFAEYLIKKGIPNTLNLS